MSLKKYIEKERKKRLDSIRKINKQVTCIRSLYKSTYESNAFIKGETYDVVLENKLSLTILDEKGNSFGPFLKQPQKDNPLYLFSEYFIQ